MSQEKYKNKIYGRDLYWIDRFRSKMIVEREINCPDDLGIEKVLVEELQESKKEIMEGGGEEESCEVDTQIPKKNRIKEIVLTVLLTAAFFVIQKVYINLIFLYIKDLTLATCLVIFLVYPLLFLYYVYLDKIYDRDHFPIEEERKEWWW